MDLEWHKRPIDRKTSLPSDGLSKGQEIPDCAFGRSVLTPVRRFNPDSPELMDQPGMARALLLEELQTLESCNRRLGGHDIVLYYVKRFVGSTRTASLSILDMGTGVADIPRAIAGWARQRQLSVKITAVDGNSEILQAAYESCHGWPEIRFEQHDLRKLPHLPESFDLVLCSSTLHHFETTDAIVVLRSIHRLARCGYIVNDLCRNWLAIWLMGLLFRALFRSTVFRHDAAKSCRAAFTVRELQAMAERAGLNHFHVKRHHAVFRMVLEGRK